MDLCFSLYTTVNKAEGRNRPIKIFAVPITFSQWQFFTQSRFVHLNNIDAICLKIEHLITYSKCNLIGTFLNRNILARK